MKQLVSCKESLPYTLWKTEEQGPLPLLALLPETCDTPQTAREKADLFLTPEFQTRHPCSVLLPERFGGWEDWDAARQLHGLLFDLEEDACAFVDGCRICLLGGSGAWAVGSRFPSRFAAVIPVSGRADPYAARNLKFTPVWAFEAESIAKDAGNAFSYAGGASSRRTVMALRTYGSRCVRETLLPGACGKQSLWEQTFTGRQGEETAAWLFSQNRKRQLQVSLLQPGLFRIDDYFTTSCYLVCGTEKALLIDTGMSEADLPALVRSLTPLPVEVAVTHPHRDHVAQAEKFERIRLQEQDIDLLPSYQNQMETFFGDQGPVMPKKEQLLPLHEGSVIALGGGVAVEAVELPGHTAHSLVFIDEFHRSVFTGDAIGSGYIVLMLCRREDWKPLISRYRQALLRFRPRLAQLEQYAWYGGHFIQENGCNLREQEYHFSQKSSYFCPISAQVAKDMLVLCELLLSGGIPEEELMSAPEHHCSYRSAGINFRFEDD